MKQQTHPTRTTETQNSLLKNENVEALKPLKDGKTSFLSKTNLG